MASQSPSASEVRPFPTSAAVVEDLARRLHGFEVEVLERPVDGQALIAVVPEGKKVQDLKPILDAYLDRPERRRGTARSFDLDSFIKHISRYDSALNCAVFAEPDEDEGPTFTAVFDYHDSALGGEANWLQHRLVYEPALSEEWRAWKAQDGVVMNQAAFAAFIEERITDLVVPDRNDEKLKALADLVQGKWAFPTEVHELSRNLSVNVETGVRSAVTLATGEITMLYDEQHKDGEGAPIKIANLFQIAIPVFYAGTTFRLAARLRYRIANGRVNWFYQLVRPDVAFEDAFRSIVDRIDEDIAGEVYLGSPEA